MPMTTVEFASIADKGSMLQDGKGSPKWPLTHTKHKLFLVSAPPLTYSFMVTNSSLATFFSMFFTNFSP